MSQARPQSLAARRPSIPTGHPGIGPGLIDEYESVRVEIELPLEPRFAPHQDIGTILLGRMPGPFDKLRRAFF